MHEIRIGYRSLKTAKGVPEKSLKSVEGPARARKIGASDAVLTSPRLGRTDRAIGLLRNARLPEPGRARRARGSPPLVADLRVQFTKAADGSNRAVMVGTDEASDQAAREARAATAAAERTAAALRSRLESLGYSDDLAVLDTFTRRFATYKQLDAEILTLAVQNTNLKAQGLLFEDPARGASDDFRRAMDAAAAAASPATSASARSAAARASIAVLEIQVVLSRHFPKETMRR